MNEKKDAAETHAAHIDQEATRIGGLPPTQEKVEEILAGVEAINAQLNTTKHYVQSARTLREGILGKLKEMKVGFDETEAQRTATESEIGLHKKLNSGSFRAFAEFLDGVLNSLKGTTVTPDELYRAILGAVQGQEDPFWKWFAGSEQAKSALKAFLEAKSDKGSSQSEEAIQSAIDNQRSVQNLKDGFPQESIDAIMATLEWAKEIRGIPDADANTLKAQVREKIGYIPDVPTRLKIFNDYKELLKLKQPKRKMIVTIGGEDVELQFADLENDQTEKMKRIGALFAQGCRVLLPRYWEDVKPEKNA